MLHVQELDHIGVLELFEQRDLAQGGARDALVLDFEPNLLQGHEAPRLEVLGLPTTSKTHTHEQTGNNNLNETSQKCSKLRAAVCIHKPHLVHDAVCPLPHGLLDLLVLG